MRKGGRAGGAGVRVSFVILVAVFFVLFGFTKVLISSVFVCLFV